MPCELRTKVTWPKDGKELKEAKKKQRKLGYKEFSPFIRDAVAAFPEKK